MVIRYTIHDYRLRSFRLQAVTQPMQYRDVLNVKVLMEHVEPSAMDGSEN